MIERFAQFGGTGGQSHPFSPGGSPLFRGGPSGGGGYGINEFGSDLGLDAIMSRTHRPGILGSDKPLETLLEIFHESIEKDAEPYLLSFDERIQLKRKKKIRSKEQNLKDERQRSESKIDQIKEKYKTIEDLLSQSRKNESVDFDKFASAYDEKNLELKLKSQHSNESSFTRTPSTPPLVNSALTSTNEFDRNELADARLSYPFTGQDYHYRPEDGFEKYQKQLSDPIFPNIHNMENDTLLTNYPNSAENTSYSAPNEFKDLSSQLTAPSKSNDLSLSEKIEKLKKKINPKRLETELGQLDWDEKTRGRWPERSLSNQTPYKNDGKGSLENTSLAGPGPAGAGVYPIAGYL
jgi:hypothetical protein